VDRLGRAPGGGGRRLPPGLNRITINAGLAGEAPGVLASTVAHEALHAVAAHSLSAGACIAEEATAFALGTLT
jgi:hypothetical protein